MWEVIVDLVQSGTTLLLTTQYLEEADRLADNILVIDHGRAIAEGTADSLKGQVGGERVEIVLVREDDLPAARAIMTELAGVPVEVSEHSRRIVAPVTGGAGLLMEALRRLDAADITVLDVALRRPTLDDVFLSLTGHASEDDADGAPAGLKQKASAR
jgi:ABC-2 type transport system ATP-binding protein